MTELTQKELEVLNIKATIFDLMRERDSYIQKSNYVFEEITRMLKKLEEII